MESVHGDPSHPNPTADEEAIKRNTDCIYFLASPLTCKKGNECEYRHSEGARMNPRDCWYWLNGNCLNPKCSFRHLPFEGFPGTPGGTSGSSFPLSQATTAAQIPATHTVAAYNSSNKQTVPCIYFQKGHCLKGDRCPFMHGSLPASNSTLQQTLKPHTAVVDAHASLQKATNLEKVTSQLKVPQVNSIKPMEAPMMAKPAVKADIVPNNGITMKNNMEPAASHEVLSRPKPSNPPLTSGDAVSKSLSHQSQLPDEPLQNGREVGEFLGESSPGFDVLVDDEVEDSDYDRPDDEYGRTAGTARRHLNTANEFDYDPLSDRGSLRKFDRDYDFRDYDLHGRAHDRFNRERRRPSPDRVFERPALMERSLAREESPGRIDKSDLRYRLSKQKKTDGRSATSPDHHGRFYQWDDRHIEEQRYTGRSHRDQSRLPSDVSISSRLQGRIKLSGRNSPDNPSDLRPDREMERRQNWGRLSPGKPISYQGRHHDKNRWTQDDAHTEARNIRSWPVKREENENLNFAGPKSLAELKGSKSSDSSEGRSTNGSNSIPSKAQAALMKNMKLGKIGHQEPDGAVSFEGPKPLSEILKRKREAETTDSKVSIGRENSRKRERFDPAISSGTVVKEALITRAMEPGQDDHGTSGYEEPGATTEATKLTEREDCNDEGADVAEGPDLVYEGQSSDQKGALENADGMMIETIEEEPDNSDQRDVEYEFEVEGGYENADLEDEYLDDDDGDDFSRRMGAMLS